MGEDKFNESQERVVASDMNLCVTAGAGSGKTKTLVGYIVNWLERGFDRQAGLPSGSSGGRGAGGWLSRPSVANVLALTYTEKAAGEMRSRLSDAMRGRLADAERTRAREARRDPGERDAKAYARARDLSLFWSEEIRNMALSEIGTIHGYAFSLVRRAGWSLGLPSTLIVDPGSGDGDLMEVIHDLLHEKDRDLLWILGRVPFSSGSPDGASLTSWLREMTRRTDEWGLDGLSPGRDVDMSPLNSLLDAVEDKAGKFFAAAGNPGFLSTKGPDARMAVQEALSVFLEEFAGLRAGLGWLAYGSGWSVAEAESGTSGAAGKSGTSGGDGTAGGPQGRPGDGTAASGELAASWGRVVSVLRGVGYTQNDKANGRYRDQMEKLLEAISALLSEWDARTVRVALSRLSGKLGDLSFAKRRARGSVIFSDMLLLARQILRERPELRAEESERWKLVVVDEFQDTNRLQADTLGYIVQGMGGTGGDPGAADRIGRGGKVGGASVARASGSGRTAVFGGRVQEDVGGRVQEDVGGRVQGDVGEGTGGGPSAGGARGGGPTPFSGIDWKKAPNGIRVFGDHKQSIYRFRGAEPGVMTDLEDALGKAGKGRGGALTLDTNYRTTDTLISFFNSYFGEAMPRYDVQKHAREAVSEGPGVTLLRIPKPQKSPYPKWALAEGLIPPPLPDTTGWDGVRTEARILASYLKDLFAGREGVQVWDEDSGWRAPRYGDCAVLIRSRTHAAAFEEALTEAGIPAWTVKGEDPFSSRVARGLASFWLSMVGVDPDLNLAAAVLSPLGPVSENALEALCLDGGRHVSISSYFRDGRPFPSGRLEAGDLRNLERMRSVWLALSGSALRRPPGETMELVVEGLELVPLIFAAGAGPDVAGTDGEERGEGTGETGTGGYGGSVAGAGEGSEAGGSGVGRDGGSGTEGSGTGAEGGRGAGAGGGRGAGGGIGSGVGGGGGTDDAPEGAGDEGSEPGPEGGGYRFGDRDEDWESDWEAVPPAGSGGWERPSRRAPSRVRSAAGAGGTAPGGAGKVPGGRGTGGVAAGTRHGSAENAPDGPAEIAPVGGGRAGSFVPEGICGGADGVRALQEVLGLVKALPIFDRSSPNSPSDLVEDLMAADNNTGEGVPEESEDADGEDSGKDGGAPDAGSLRDGAVNIMTIHRSKGLERRVVVVPQAHVPDRARSKSLLIGDGGELALKFVPVGGSGVTTGPQYGELRKEDLAKSREEHLRIFYVAATRARDRLVLVGDSIRPQTYKLLKADWESGAGGGGAPVSGRSEEFDRYGWLHHLESWPRRSGHLELRDAGPERYYKAWNPPDAPAVGGHAGIGKAGSTGSGMAGAYGIGKSGLAGTEKAGSEGIGKAGTTGTGKGGAEGSWNAGTAVPSSPADGGGEFRPAMIDPLPPTGAWTGTVTSYARLLAEGEGALRNSRRDVGARVADPWGRYAGEGGDALDDPVSSEGARLDKAGDMGVADGVAGGAEPPAGAAPAGDPGHREQGIIVHAILESTDFASDLESYRAAVRRAAEANGIALSDAMEDELAGHALRFQESRMGREVREALEAGREVWREWPFWFRMEDDGLGRGPVTLSGVVDLFYVNSRGEGVLVDYKLFRPRDAASYDRQVEIYAKALRSATGFAGTVVAELRYLTEKE